MVGTFGTSSSSSPSVRLAGGSSSGGGGQNTPATSGWSKRERKTLIPSTIEVRSLASSADQPLSYHRSMASTRSLYSPPGSQSHFWSASAWAIMTSSGMTASTGDTWSAIFWASPIFRARSSASTVQR